MNQITNLALLLGEYPNGVLIEDGDTVSIRNLRVEILVTVGATPSEHWTGRLVLEHRPEPGDVSARHSMGNWVFIYPHQNLGPDKAHTANVGQLQQPVEAGGWTVRVTFVGDESNEILIAERSFINLGT